MPKRRSIQEANDLEQKRQRENVAADELRPSSSTLTSTTEQQPGAGLVDAYADQLAVREARAPAELPPAKGEVLDLSRTTEVTSPELAKLCSKYMRMSKSEFAVQVDPASAAFNLDVVFAEVKQMAATGLTQAKKQS